MLCCLSTTWYYAVLIIIKLLFVNTTYATVLFYKSCTAIWSKHVLIHCVRFSLDLFLSLCDKWHKELLNWEYLCTYTWSWKRKFGISAIETDKYMILQIMYCHMLWKCVNLSCINTLCAKLFLCCMHIFSLYEKWHEGTACMISSFPEHSSF